jgi:hypothetical protein
LKNQKTQSNSPDRAPARKGSRTRHILHLTGFALALLILLALFSLMAVGLPTAMTRRIAAQAQEAGLPIQVQSIRLSAHHGWVLGNARIYSTSPDDLLPLLSMKKLYILFWPADWKNPVAGGWHVKVYAKNIDVSLGAPWEELLPGKHPFRTISRIKASLTAAPRRIAIESSELRWGGITVLANGDALFAGGESSENSRKGITSLRRRAAQAANLLSQLKCEQPPQLNLAFHFDAARPELSSLDAALSAAGLTVRDRVYQSFSGTATCRTNLWTVDELQLSRTNLEQLVLRGSVDLTTSNAQVSVENTLSASDLFNLLPAEAQSAVAQTGIRPFGRLDFAAAAGPAPYDRIAEKIDVQIRQAHLTRQDLTLDPVALRLVRDRSRIDVTALQAVVNGGPLSGQAEIHLDSGAWIAQVQSQCDPAPLGTLFGGTLQEFISRFRFQTELPKAALTLSQAASGANLYMEGTLSGNRFSCGGVPIGHLDAFMVYSNEVLNLTPIHVVRGKEQFDGNVQVDFIRDIASFNATNSFPPSDIARALAPGEHTLLEQIRFGGPVSAAGQGQIDYSTWTNHSFAGQFSAGNIGMGNLQAALLNAEVQVTGTQMLFTNAAMNLYDGTAEGSAEFDISLADGSAPYRINARLSRLDLPAMLRQVASSEYERASGRLSATLNLTADAKAGFWKSAQGEGTVKVEDGRLATLPLFGGFSRLVQSAFAGFNLFSLTAFAADYQLHDGALWSDNAQLGGTLISARGRGSYSPASGLNFVVAAEPLRQTGDRNQEWYQVQCLAATAVAPFLRLLEFQLSGPLDKPEWRFVNLPGNAR